MKYFLDQEFHEFVYKPFIGKKHHVIELISIGIVAEDGREFYEVSKEFDLKAAWNNEWIRENVLQPVWRDLCRKESNYTKTFYWRLMEWSYKGMKNLLRWHGKTNKQIAQGIKEFVCSYELASEYGDVDSLSFGAEMYLESNPPEFYGYYSDYDWVLFCSLFGRMIDLPKGFPMYCIDLKQTLDEAAATVPVAYSKDLGLTSLKLSDNYPKQENEHNALADAKWNKNLYYFLQDYNAAIF